MYNVFTQLVPNCVTRGFVTFLGIGPACFIPALMCLWDKAFILFIQKQDVYFSSYTYTNTNNNALFVV